VPILKLNPKRADWVTFAKSQRRNPPGNPNEQKPFSFYMLKDNQKLVGNLDLLRGAIDRGTTSDKVPASDPSAAPLGTDEEARERR
jgi:hypothetical protein